MYQGHQLQDFCLSLFLEYTVFINKLVSLISQYNKSIIFYLSSVWIFQYLRELSINRCNTKGWTFWFKSIWSLVSFLSCYLHRIINYEKFRCFSIAYPVPIILRLVWHLNFLNSKHLCKKILSFFWVVQFPYQWYNRQKMVS